MSLASETLIIRLEFVFDGFRCVFRVVYSVHKNNYDDCKQLTCQGQG